MELQYHSRAVHLPPSVTQIATDGLPRRLPGDVIVTRGKRRVALVGEALFVSR